MEDKEFQQKLVDKLKNGELSYEDTPIYTIILDLVQGNGKEEILRVFNEVVRKDNKTEHLLSTETNKNRLLEDVKQETLEERVEWIALLHKQNLNGRETEDELFEAGILAGIEETEEIMYSEEEVIAFGEFIFKHSLLTHTRGVKSLFEQFKNK